MERRHGGGFRYIERMKRDRGRGLTHSYFSNNFVLIPREKGPRIIKDELFIKLEDGYGLKVECNILVVIDTTLIISKFLQYNTQSTSDDINIVNL